MKLLTFALLFAQQALLCAQQVQQHADVVGKVIDSLTGMPVPRARVLLARNGFRIAAHENLFDVDPAADEPDPKSDRLVVITGLDGGFSFRIDAPAKFYLFAEAAGYVKSRVVIDPKSAYEVKPGVITDDIPIRLIRELTVEEAIKISLEFTGTIHLLLTDVMMPGMSGPDLAKKLMEQRTEMRVMLMTGYADGELLILNYGWRLITKPFVPTLLREKVNAVLHSPNRSQGTDHFDTSGGKPSAHNRLSKSFFTA